MDALHQVEGDIGLSSTVRNIVDLVAERLKEKEAHLAPAQDIKEAWKELPVQEHPESTLVGPEQGASARRGTRAAVTSGNVL